MSNEKFLVIACASLIGIGGLSLYIPVKMHEHALHRNQVAIELNRPIVYKIPKEVYEVIGKEAIARRTAEDLQELLDFANEEIMARKTADVRELVDYANAHLARTDEYADQKFKAGICLMIEQVLHNAGQYAGYSNNRWTTTGYKEWRAAGCPQDNSPFTGPEYDRSYHFKR